MNPPWIFVALATAAVLVAGCAKDVATTAPTPAGPGAPALENATGAETGGAGTEGKAPSAPATNPLGTAGSPAPDPTTPGATAPGPPAGAGQTDKARPSEGGGTSAPFIGTYRIVMSPEQVAEIEAMLEKLPEADRQTAREVQQLVLAIQPEGRYSIRSMGRDMPGKYTVKGDQITLEPVTGPGGERSPESQPIVLTYDPGARTLTGESGGNTIRFRRE